MKLKIFLSHTNEEGQTGWQRKGIPSERNIKLTLVLYLSLLLGGALTNFVNTLYQRHVKSPTKRLNNAIHKVKQQELR